MSSPKKRIAIALTYGAVCHGIFALGVGSMIAAMFFGMSRSLGAAPEGWAWLANAILLAQFPVLHSFLLTDRGRKLLTKLAPGAFAKDLASTTYAAIAAFQVFILFALWTPSGVVWWQATGPAFWLLCGLYALSWALLMKSMLDAGIQLQSGLLGWWAVLRNVKPKYPDMPTSGLFRVVRQPIYVTFAMTLWTVPVWTPDQLFIAITLTAYCVLGPLFKERRFERLFGDRFRTYQKSTPYWLPIPVRGASQKDAET